MFAWKHIGRWRCGPLAIFCGPSRNPDEDAPQKRISSWFVEMLRFSSYPSSFLSPVNLYYSWNLMTQSPAISFRSLISMMQHESSRIFFLYRWRSSLTLFLWKRVSSNCQSIQLGQETNVLLPYHAINGKFLSLITSNGTDADPRGSLLNPLSFWDDEEIRERKEKIEIIENKE